MEHVTPIRWWQWIPFWPWRVVAVAESANDVPLRLPRNGVVLVGSPEFHKWLVFDCPCRGRHRIMLPLDPKHRPHWSVFYNGSLTVSPSVDYAGKDRRCHYFLRNGRIEWVSDSWR